MQVTLVVTLKCRHASLVSDVHVDEVIACIQQIRSEQTARVGTPDEVKEPVVYALLRLFGSLRWSLRWRLWWRLLRSVFIIIIIIVSSSHIVQQIFDVLIIGIVSVPASTQSFDLTSEKSSGTDHHSL